MSSQNFSTFVEISFNLPMDSVWTYHVPQELESKIMLGSKVKADFVNKKKMGVVVKIHKTPPSFETKPVDTIIEDNIFLPPYVFHMRDQISSYYGCSLNEALHLFVFDSQLPARKTLQIKTYSEPNDSPVSKEISLNEEQKYAVENIWSKSKEGKIFLPALLHGVTGSGKTEVYQTLIKKILQTPGKQALLLLPEIGITTHIFQRLSSYFPNETIGFIHSQMTTPQKRKMFQSINSGKIRIIIGPRSALFSPFKNLGLIIMDEEHDFSYKSQSSPRYHTRRVAFILSKHLQIPFVMGSATPSLETYYAAKQEQILLLTLSKRFWNTPLPSIEMIDMQDRKEIFSEKLLQKLVRTKKKQKQSILFLNRRGFSPFLVCEQCSYAFVCPNCSISLTYHKKQQRLLCHYCGYECPTPSRCPECKSSKIRPRGTGTQKLEEEIQELLHGYRVLRVDRDSVKSKKNYENIMEAFEQKQADMLIGTQMISKGLDFPDVELVGIISCDLILHIPDFRSGEYVFALITQVAGRSGRKALGEVVLQTRFPHHYAVQAALAHDYLQFFDKELQMRKEYAYPPFTKLIRLIIRSFSRQIAEDTSIELSKELQSRFPNTEILGPSACIVEKIHNQYRYHLILRVKDPLRYINQIKLLIKTHNKKDGCYVECDVDPISML